MTNTDDAIASLETYLNTREQLLPMGIEPGFVADIDMGSKGHVRLNVDDLREVLKMAKRADQALRFAQIDVSGGSAYLDDWSLGYYRACEDVVKRLSED